MKKFLLGFLILCIGCASIISGGSQGIPITSHPTGAIVRVGNMVQKTPCIIMLNRKDGIQHIIIEKEGYEPVPITLRKTLNGWVWGNALMGLWGIIGVAVDCATGSVSKFTPTDINVSLVKRLEAKVTGQDILVLKVK